VNIAPQEVKIDVDYALLLTYLWVEKPEYERSSGEID